MGRASIALVVGMLFCGTAGAAEPRPVEWNPAWHEVHWAEGVGTAVLLGYALFGRSLLPEPTLRWEGPILFDAPVRDLMRVGTEPGREAHRAVSDTLFFGLTFYPLVVDVGVLAGAVHRDWKVTSQLFLMDLEAIALSGAVAATPQQLAGRARPSWPQCESDPEYAFDCGTTNQLESFYSGHTSLAFTGAALVCVHTEHLDLYGSHAAGRAACWTGVGLASLAGVLRITADRHWTTDVLVGAGVGLAAGYLLPKAHFGWRVVPTANAHHVGVGAVGRW